MFEDQRVTYWHLTPRGWVRGGGDGEEDPPSDRCPDDRVMTCVYVESSWTQEVHTVWIRDAKYARKLMWRFGRCPWTHDASAHPGVVGG